MGYLLFSQEWADLFREQLNQNESYATSAAAWEWSVVLQSKSDDEQSRAVFLDLWHGSCRNAYHIENERQIERADFLIRGSEQTWYQLHKGNITPIPALMQGKLKLVKGSLPKLVSYSGAANALMEVANSIDTDFPSQKSDEDFGTADKSSNEITATDKVAEPESRITQSLDVKAFPYKLFQKAKRLGTWNPEEIDFTPDKNDWQSFTDLEKEVLLHLTSLFLAGEESVTQDLLPLMMVISGEQRLEEELYLTTFLFEEAKHAEFFHLFLDRVADNPGSLEQFHDTPYKKLFYDELPNAMNRLLSDSSPRAQINASVTYNLVVEGVLAETGYHAYYEMLENQDLMPGLRKGITLLKQDESRHIAYGVYLLSRIIGSHPELWSELQTRMNELLDIAIQIIENIFDRYEVMPFGLTKERFLDIAMAQFRKRLNALDQAKETGQPTF